MPSWAECQTHAGAGLIDLAAGMGQALTYAPAGGVPVDVSGVLTSGTDSIDLFTASGELRLQVLLPMSAIADRPTTGDKLSTAAGDWYDVDGDAEDLDQMWRCLLTPGAAPVAVFVQLLSADGIGLAAANGDVIGVGSG